MNHRLSPEDMQRAHSEQAIERRRATFAMYAEVIEGEVIRLWNDGLVASAIATDLDIPVDRVTAVLKDNGIEIPAWMTSTGSKVPLCTSCGRPKHGF